MTDHVLTRPTAPGRTARSAIAGIAAGALLLAACAPAAPAPTAAPTAAPAPPTQAPAKPTEAPKPAPTTAPAPTAAPAAPTAAPKPTAAPATAKPAATAGSGLQLLKPLPPLNPPVTVKARVGSSLTTAPFWYAVEKGYFDQLGIKFEQVEIQNSGDVVSPLATGQLDVAGTSIGSGLYNAVNKGVNVKAVSDNGQLGPNLAGAAAVVKKGTLSQYGNDWCSLKGKKVAMVSKTTGLFVTLVEALKSCNLTVDDVQLTEIGFPETNVAVNSGAVDVGFQVEPFVSVGVANGTLEIWKPLDQAFKNQQMNVLLYSEEFQQNKEAGLRFMVAYLAGARDYRRAIEGTGDKQEMEQILARHLATKDPAAYGNMIMMAVDPNGAIDMPTLQESIKVFQDTGSLEKGDVKLGWIDDTFRNQALEYLGPYKP